MTAEDRNAMRRLVFATFFILAPVSALAGPCDVSWDGNRLAENARGRSLGAEMRLLDTGNNVNAVVTVAQIMAFYEAKEAIARQVHRSPSFIVCNGNEPNAFAGEGNNGETVGVTVGMIKLANGDRDMAAAVIGHEYAHHIENHATIGEMRDLFLNVLGAIVGAVLESKIQTRTGVQGLGLNLGQVSATLVSRKFSRDQEREADELGFGYMVAAGFNPNGAIRLAARMNQMGAGGAGLFFDSHPGWDERSDRFRSMIAKNPTAQQIIARTGNATTLLAANVSNSGQATIALAPAFTMPAAQKSFNDGLAAWRKSDFATASREFRLAAEAGYGPAQTSVGWIYQSGQGGLPKDDVQAVRWFRLSADQGNADGQNWLAIMYASGRGGLLKDDAQAVQWYRKAADQGYALGQSNLGAMYESGRGGLPKDDAQAVQWYRKAADQGNAQGQYNLGLMYEKGLGGLAKDDAQAVQWYRKAAEQGFANAQHNLGGMYASGRGGLPKDEAQAVQWYRKAADQGNAGAQRNLGLMYESGRGGLPKDDAQAVQWYRKAADQGNAFAQSSVGLFYITGRGGLQKDEAAAIRWFRLSADQGAASGEMLLGAAYEEGRGGLSKDIDTAVSWYQKAAAKGQAVAIARLKVLGRQ